MQRAWQFRHYLLPLAGVVCWTGLSWGAELLGPPRPPADNDGLILDSRASKSPQPVTIAPLTTTPAVQSPVDEELRSPAEPLVFQPRRQRDANAPPDPVPMIEPPLAAYPEIAPPVVYAQSCPLGGCPTGVVPTCATGMYCTTPACGSYDSSCNVNYGMACDSCAPADNVCCSCVPNWTVRAELLIWNRAGGTDVPLVPAPVAVSSADLTGDWQVGPRLTVIKHGIFGSCWDLEAAYFNIDGWTGTRTVAGATTYLTTPPTNFPAAPITLTYSSELQNFELNGRRAYSDWVTWFVGFRALQVDELLSADINTGAATHSVVTSNQLYGAQLGVDALLLDCDYWYFNAVGKVGIYGNSADQTTRTAGIGGALPLITYTGNETAFVGELNFNANYRLTDRLTFLAGYNLLWVNGLALAPDQLAATNIATGVGALDTGGNLFYHGFNVGLEYGW